MNEGDDRLETKIIKKQNKKMHGEDQLLIEYTYEADHLCWSCVKARDENCSIYNSLIRIIEEHEADTEIGFFISRCKHYQKDPTSPF